MSEQVDMLYYEREGRLKNYTLIGGVDEAGRGPLAGPVAAACVILPEGYCRDDIKDSKRISPKKREKLYEIIKEEALGWYISFASVEYIEEHNILNATKKAVLSAIAKTVPKPDYLLIDALDMGELSIAHKSLIKGDALSISIGAASILAKVERDRIMVKYDSIYPQYNFARHKGYGTREHIEAIKKYGPCKIHRRSFLKNIICE